MFFQTELRKILTERNSVITAQETEIRRIRNVIYDFLRNNPDCRKVFGETSYPDYASPESLLEYWTNLIVRQARNAARDAEIRRVIAEIEAEKNNEEKKCD